MDISVKKISLAHVLCVVLSMGVAASAFAEAPAEATANSQHQILSGLQATFEAYRETRSDLAEGLVQKVAKRSLDNMVAEGCNRLRAVGEIDLAAQYEQEWKNQISVVLDSNLSTFELGDFNPISPWLDNFYNTLYRKTRGIVKGIRVIHDIYLMNYALNVVFKPNGEWRQHTAYDRIEYRKHFIPFADIATYWISLKVCQRYLQQYQKYCSNGAGYLERFTGKYVFPRISDQVFAMAIHGHNSSVVSAPEDLSFEQFQGEAANPSNASDIED
jgi:hypothetical protein